MLAFLLAAAPAPSPSPHPGHKKKAVAAHKAPVRKAKPKPTAKPKAGFSTLPIIANVVSAPFCSALRNRIRPVIGAMITNDAIVASSRPMFEDYLKYESNGPGNEGLRDMSLMHMENLVTPLVTSLASIDQLLDDTNAFHYPPRTADDKRLLALRDKLQAVEAYQKASLDVISGFVDSEQLAQLQVAGNDVNASITGGGPGGPTSNGQTPPTPNPALQEDPNVIPGLPQNPYTIDPATIPGLSLGSNPIRHVIEGLQWTQARAALQEVPATNAVLQGVKLCSGHVAAPAPAGSPTPSSSP